MDGDDGSSVRINGGRADGSNDYQDQEGDEGEEDAEGLHGRRAMPWRSIA